jgi:hypothetical protein
VREEAGRVKELPSQYVSLHGDWHINSVNVLNSIRDISYAFLIRPFTRMAQICNNSDEHHGIA